jgi:transposase
MMARLYYVEKVRMAKLVKKYNVSFSTITDILKKYDSQGRRLPKPPQRENNPKGAQETNDGSLKQESGNDCKVEYASPEADQ